MQLRRRLRNGLTATAQYALSKAMDDAGAFTGVNTSGSAIAQDWRNLEAEWAPSNFDQRHLLTAQVQYTSGVGTSGGGLLDGAIGKFFRGWTLTSQLTAGSGLPLTPVYLTSVAGHRRHRQHSRRASPACPAVRPTATTSTRRRTRRRPPDNGATPGATRSPGRRQFALDAGIGRTFLWGDRLNLDWRVNATNVLNRVTYAAVNTFVGSPQFGLPTAANPMRKLQSSLRVRF